MHRHRAETLITHSGQIHRLRRGRLSVCLSVCVWRRGTALPWKKEVFSPQALPQALPHADASLPPPAAPIDRSPRSPHPSRRRRCAIATGSLSPAPDGRPGLSLYVPASATAAASRSGPSRRLRRSGQVAAHEPPALPPVVGP